MRNSAGMSTFFVFMSILGGLHVFGMLGIFYGPLILGFAAVMVSLYGEEYHDLLVSKVRASSLVGTAPQQMRTSVSVVGAYGHKVPRPVYYVVPRRKNR
jgi:hypothetical protein